MDRYLDGFMFPRKWGGLELAFKADRQVIYGGGGYLYIKQRNRNTDYSVPGLFEVRKAASEGHLE